MSISNLSYSPSQSLLVNAVQCQSVRANAPSSLMACSFSNQAVSGVLSMSGGDASGLLISSSTGAVRIAPTAGARAGVFTADNGTPVVVACAGLGANSVVLLTVKTATGANAGSANVVAVVAGTSFSIASGVADTSVYNYLVIDNQ